MPPMMAHTPVRKWVKDLQSNRGLARHPLSAAQGPGGSTRSPHLCFSVSFTIMGESS